MQHSENYDPKKATLILMKQQPRLLKHSQQCRISWRLWNLGAPILDSTRMQQCGQLEQSQSSMEGVGEINHQFCQPKKRVSELKDGRPSTILGYTTNNGSVQSLHQNYNPS